jgi:hypothetical protein
MAGVGKRGIFRFIVTFGRLAALNARKNRDVAHKRALVGVSRQTDSTL